MTPTATYQDKPWLGHYQRGVPEQLAYEKACLPDFLERSAARFPDKMALSFQGLTVTYSKLQSMVEQFAVCLDRFGIAKGDVVALLLPNVIPCVVAYYATLRIGAIAVMNNPLYTDRELEHQLNDSGAKLLITLDLLANRMIDLRSKTQVRQIVYTSIGDYLPFPKNLLFPLVGKRKKLAADVKPADKVFRWKPLLADAKSQTGANAPKADLSFDDVAMYQYTGGTTGVSKGAILTHGNLSCQSKQVAAWFPGMGSDQIMLGALPFFHVFGLTTVHESGHIFWMGQCVDPQTPGRRSNSGHCQRENHFCSHGPHHVHRHPAGSRH